MLSLHQRRTGGAMQNRPANADARLPGGLGRRRSNFSNVPILY
ncbi:hypothetical protein GJA_726 [Janthinobacterium agaricidamnosum NBRC 102515 = DSM 9628]|uniref:Uncharacterized protein n=1 Tax=Janthinobacterium agaricidamnosum NBRC 102515 = DSM 9628 TaxID=1349767 RepID=W0V0I7_9BURK|nr:hypothetical protein GJA_726 [Janthinobacterium agaricidamnosum NBRC 102515 = DSM 9628]